MNLIFREKFLVPALIVIGIAIQVFLVGSFNVSSGIVSNLIVFLSIVFGFCVTSLAIFSTSKKKDDLYEIHDKDNPSKTLLHSLVSKYRNGLFIALTSIIYFLILQVQIEHLSLNTIPLGNPLALLVIPLMAINVYYGFILTRILSDLIISEARG